MTSLFVRAGTVISASVWNAMAAAIRSLRLVAGVGVRLRSMPDGTVISFDANVVLWLHPFRVTQITPRTFAIRPGLVNTVPASIGGKPLDGGETEDKPLLEVRNLQVDSNGCGWIAVECSFGDRWEVLKAEVVQVADLDSDDGSPRSEPNILGAVLGGTITLPGRRARHPLAMIRRRASGAIALFPCTQHNLKHRAQVLAPASDFARHFFSPDG